MSRFVDEFERLPGGCMECGGPRDYDVTRLLAHAKALETLLESEEWTPWDGTSTPVWCRQCHGTPVGGHAPNCPKDALLHAE